MSGIFLSFNVSSSCNILIFIKYITMPFRRRVRSAKGLLSTELFGQNSAHTLVFPHGLPNNARRLDDQELTMETRRQSEKQLQKAREKERAQATRISDEEKRNSAINNAMKHWRVVKKDHKKLVRKPSESSCSKCSRVGVLCWFFVLGDF